MTKEDWENLQCSAHMLQTIDELDGPTFQQIADRFPLPPDTPVDLKKSMPEDLRHVLETMCTSRALKVQDGRYYVSAIGFFLLTKALPPDAEDTLMKGMLYYIRAADGITREELGKRYKDNMEQGELFNATLDNMVMATILVLRDEKFYIGPKGLQILRTAPLIRQPTHHRHASSDMKDYTIHNSHGEDPYQEFTAELLVRTKAKAVVCFIYQGEHGDSLTTMTSDPTIQIHLGDLLQTMGMALKTHENPWIDKQEVKV